MFIHAWEMLQQITTLADGISLFEFCNGSLCWIGIKMLWRVHRNGLIRARENWSWILITKSFLLLWSTCWNLNSRYVLEIRKRSFSGGRRDAVYFIDFILSSSHWHLIRGSQLFHWPGPDNVPKHQKRRQKTLASQTDLPGICFLWYYLHCRLRIFWKLHDEILLGRGLRWIISSAEQRKLKPWSVSGDQSLRGRLT